MNPLHIYKETKHWQCFRNILKEPQINLPKKFDDTCSKFWGFVNQVCFIIQLDQHHYPDDQTQVGLSGTLLLGTTLTWFAPLLEHQSPFLNNFETFFENVGASFGNSEKKIQQQTNCELFAKEHAQLLCMFMNLSN